MTGKRTLMLVSGEASGDLYGSLIAKELMRKKPHLNLIGVGGSQMRNAGVEILHDSSSWGTIGLVEAIKKVPKLYFTLLELKKTMEEIKPDLLVCIDYPGFNMRLVRIAKSLGIKVAYYVPPSKWTQDSGQIIEAAQLIDKVITTYPSTTEIYQKAGADVVFVGHPVLDLIMVRENRANILEKIGLEEGKKIVGLMPGSREKEIHYLLDLMINTAKRMKKRDPSLQFVLPLVSSTLAIPKFNEGYIRDIIRKSRLDIKLVVDNTYEAMSVFDLGIVASGTATLELACFVIPMVIVYKVSKITELIARTTLKLPPFFGLPNIILNKRAVPELLQAEVSSGHITELAMNILQDQRVYSRQKQELAQIKSILGRPGAASRAADTVLELVGEPIPAPITGELIGLVAGNGRFPTVIAEEILKRGYKLSIIALEEEADRDLGNKFDDINWISVGQMDTIIQTLKEKNISKAIFAGKIHKTLMFTNMNKDERLNRMLQNLDNRGDDSLLLSFTDELAKEDITVLESPPFLTDLMPGKGVLTKTQPDPSDWPDIRYGFAMAKKMGGIDVGQTVVVKDQAVLAVEAIEGTDDTIRRGSSFAKGGVIVAKVSKPSQDMRFDVPVIGLKTIEVLIEAKAKILVIEANKTIFLDLDEVIELADSAKLTIIAI